jgi:hypothetical protein
MIAVCMEKRQDSSKADTIAAYEEFIYEFQNDPAFQTLPDWEGYLNEAERAIDRLTFN